MCVIYPLDESRPTNTLWNPPDYSKSRFLRTVTMQLDDISYNVLTINLMSNSVTGIQNHALYIVLLSLCLKPSLLISGHKDSLIYILVV